MSERLVAILAPPDVTLLDVTGPWEVFCRAALCAPGAYRIVVASTGEQLQVGTKFGLQFTCHCALSEVDPVVDTILVAGSDEGVSGRANTQFLSWLRERFSSARRVGSVCTGAFYLAHAGLLAGRRATTHWRYAQQLSEQFRDIHVESDPIFVRDDKVYTSAGISAAIHRPHPQTCSLNSSGGTNR